MGTHCEVAISPCASNPCLYGGTCATRGEDFYCQCRGQYSGQRYVVESLPLSLGEREPPSFTVLLPSSRVLC